MAVKISIRFAPKPGATPLFVVRYPTLFRALGRLSLAVALFAGFKYFKGF